MRRSGWWISVGLVLGLVACSTDPRSLPPDAPLADLFEGFSGCGNAAIDRPDPAGYLATVDAWIEVASIEPWAGTPEFGPEHWEHYTVVAADGRTHADLGMGNADVPAVEWSLTHGFPAWLAVDRDREGVDGTGTYVAYTLVLAESGAFFPGFCMDAYLRSAVAAVTDDVDATLRSLPSLSGPEIEALVLPGDPG